MSDASAPFLFAVSTLGRIDALDALLTSLIPQLSPADRVAIVAQDRFEEVSALVERHGVALGDRLRMTTSARGASLGRNTAVALHPELPDDALLMFPNDTTWFPAGAVAAIRAGMGDAPAGAVVVMTPAGPRFDLPPVGTPLDTWTVWSVIEMGLVLRRSLFASASGFDVGIGTGAATAWQAGEVTDLLMRLLATHPSLRERFLWLHGEGAQVGGIEETRGLAQAERTRKLRAYGRGIGHVYRIHPFPWWQRWAFVAAGLLIGIRRGSEYTLSDGATAFAGRLEGVRGRLRDGGRHRAVER